MGLNPENPDYEIGIDNPTCHASLFASETPKYVEVRIEGITKCPFVVPDPPNGAFLLTQLAGGTLWRFLTVDYIITWELSAAFSRFQALTLFGAIFFGWFFHQRNVTCQTDFINQTNCANPRTLGSNGTSKIFWGPAIHT